MKWQDKLTKREKEHMRENGIRTLGDMKKQVRHIKEIRENNGPSMVCYDCIDIARKLGLWE